MQHPVQIRPKETDPARHLVRVSVGGQPWEVVVEPDEEDRVVLVITTYKIEIMA